MDLSIALAGVQIGAFVILFVQSLKFLGVEQETHLRLGALGGALGFAAMWFLIQFVPESEVYVNAVVVAISAILTATLGYGYAVKPLAERMGISVRSIEINEG